MVLLEEIVGGSFDRIVVESSPYLRTMMTCASLCKGMDQPTFRVNYMFSEYQEDKIQYSEGNQIPKLISKTTPKEEFVSRYLQGVEFTDEGLHQDYILGRFPEEKEQVKERAATFKSEFVEMYGKRTGVKTLHIVVSHGTPIRMFSQLMGGQKKKVRYCGVTGVSICPKENSEPEFKMLCNCKHNHDKQSSYCAV